MFGPSSSQSLLSCFSSLIGSSLRRSALSADAYVVSLEFANPFSSLLVFVFAAVGVSLSFLPLASLSIYY